MLKRILSITLLATMIVTNLSSVVTYAAEANEETVETIEEDEEGGEGSSVENSDKSDDESEENEEDTEEEESDEMDETEDIEDEEISESKDEEVSLSESELTKDVNGYKIKAEGMMPEGAELSVAVVEEINEVEALINEKISDDVEYHVYAAFDIDILVNGEKWQPVDFDELVKIKVTGIDIEESKENITYEPGDIIEEISEEAVYRVENEEVTKLEASVTEDEVTFDTEHFTVFTVGGVSYNTNNGTCVFDTTKTYTLYSPVTSTEFTTTFDAYPMVKIYWFNDTKTLYWDMVDPNPSSIPCIKSAYSIGYGTEGSAYAFKVADYDAETLVFSEGFTTFMKNSSEDFQNCTTIKKVVCPSTLEEIINSCFEGCTALETVDMSKVTTDFTVGISAFRGCSNLVSCVLPQTTKIIDHSAFSGCSKLETIGDGLPPSLVRLGSLVFTGCINLKLKTTLPDTLMYLQSFKGSNGLRSENVEVTGTLPANLKIFKCVWSNSGVHFAYLNNIKLRGDIPAGVEEIGKTMFTTYPDQSIESQSYFTRNLSSVEITAENRIPVKYVIEDRVGSETGTLLGSNEYLGFVGLENNISDHMTKWNDSETISYEGYTVKDNTATVTPVLDSEGTVAKAVRIWSESEKYFYLKVFRNGVAGELDGDVTLVNSNTSYPLTLNAEYTDNGIYKIAYDPDDITAASYYYSLQVYIGDTKARDLYSRRYFYGYYKQGAAVCLSPTGYWDEGCYFTHKDKATGKNTYNLDVLTNAKKISEIDLDEIRAIDFDDATDEGYLINYFTSSSGFSPMEGVVIYVDYQDWAFIADANTGTYSDGSSVKYVEYYGMGDNQVYSNGLPEEPTKEGYVFADWESVRNNEIIPDWYEAGDSSEDVVKGASNAYYGNTHRISLDILGDHLEDMAYKHYINNDVDSCYPVHVATRYAKYRPIITLDANGGVYSNGEEVYKTTIKNTSSSFNYIDRPANPTREGYTFAGYTPNNGFINNKNSFAYEADTPTEYTATWSINHVYVSFAQNGGSYVPSQYIEWGGKATKPEDPVKSRYSFIGWYTDSTYSTPVDWENDTYKESTALYPLYKKKPFVTFNTNGGSSVASEYVEYMGKLSKPEDPTKGGYTFTKWYKDENLSEEYDFDTVLTEDLDLYAGWNANTYTITYDYDGGSVTDANKTSYKPTDDSFVLNNASKKHYVFRGYTVENDESGGFEINYPQGSLTIPKGTYGNLTIKAEFSEKAMHTVTFDLGYEGSTPFTQKVYDGEAVEKPEDPVREGYFFKCWKNSYGTELYLLSDAVYGDLKYTAVWIKSYAITFNAAGGAYSDGTSAVTLYTDKNGHVSYIPRPNKPAYYFNDAWYVGEDRSSAMGYTVSTNFAMWKSDMTLYAQYGRRVFDISYVLDGGTTESTLYTGYDGSLEVVIPDDVNKEGYYFMGWTIENDGADGATYSINEPNKGIVIPKDVYGNLIVRAHYSKKCDVTLNANGGKFKDGKVTKHVITDENGRIIIPETPEREGYTFKGWENNKTPFNADTDILTDDTELKAVWELNKVTITFVSDGEVVDKKTYYYGDEVKAPSVSKEGYTFTGWNPTFASIAKNDTTYTANFRVNTYRIKFVDHNGNIISNKTYTYGSNIDIPEDPVRTGYRFKGYSPEVSTVCKGNAEYKATYSIMTYTVQFVDYDGRQISKVRYTYGDTVNVPDSPSRSGYLFSGWDKTVSKTATADVTYKAVYNQIIVKYMVTFIDQNGYIVNSREYSKGETVYVPEAPERKGYEFTGWTPNVVKTCEGAATYKATYEKEETEPETKTYLITFAGYNGQIVSSASYKEGEAVSIPNAPEVDGYNFRNWYPSVEAKATKSVTYTAVYDAKPTPIEEPKPKKEKEEEKEPEPLEDEEPIEEKPSDNEKPDEIPKKEKFTVVFKDSDGKVISRKVYNEGDDIEIPEAPEKEGYKFEGWSPKVSKKADKNTEYKTIYTKEEPAPEEPKEEKKPLTVSPVVKSLVAGAACVGILTAGYFSGVWLLLLNLLFIGKRKKWRGILTEDDNKYVKTVKNLDDEEANISVLFDDMSGDVNTFMDSVSILKSYTVLPLGTKMFVTLSNSSGTDVRNFDDVNEDSFYEVLLENVSEDTRVILNLLNERCDVNIEIEFSITAKDTDNKTSSEPKNKTVAWKEEPDGDLEYLDVDDIPDYS